MEGSRRGQEAGYQIFDVDRGFQFYNLEVKPRINVMVYAYGYISSLSKLRPPT